MSRPSVLLITPYLKQQRGNTVTSLRLLKGLSQLGYAMDMLSLDSPQGWSWAAERLSKGDYQLLHILHAASLEQVWQRLPDTAGLPLVLTTTGTDINVDLFGPQRPVIEKALQQADRIVVFSPTFVPILTSSLPDISAKLRIIPQAVDLSDHPAWNRSQLNYQGDDIIAVLPSGLRPVKRIEWALQAMEMAAVYCANLHLVVVGPNIDHRYAQAILNNIEQLPRTVYLGEVDHKEMAGLYGIADLVLNTSLVEGQPQAALEGMSMGLPAIMSAVTGNLGIMTSGKEGFYVDSPQELAQAMITLADNRPLRLEMGAAAASLVHQNYAVEWEWEQYHTLYRELLGS